MCWVSVKAARTKTKSNVHDILNNKDREHNETDIIFPGNAKGLESLKTLEM